MQIYRRTTFQCSLRQLKIPATDGTRNRSNCVERYRAMSCVEGLVAILPSLRFGTSEGSAFIPNLQFAGRLEAKKPFASCMK